MTASLPTFAELAGHLEHQRQELVDLDRRLDATLALIGRALEEIERECDCCGEIGGRYVQATDEYLCPRCKWQLAHPTECSHCGGRKDARDELCQRCAWEQAQPYGYDW